MNYNEFYARSINEPEAFGPNKPMPLNGITNPKSSFQKIKMIIRYGSKTDN